MKIKKLSKIAESMLVHVVAIIIIMQMLVSESFVLITSNKERFDLLADNRAEGTTFKQTLKLDVESQEREIEFELNKPVIKTSDGEFELEGVDLIKEAIKVLNVPYDSGMNNMYYNWDLENTPSELDCAGLIQWAIAKHFNNFNNIIKGFHRQNEFLPRSCYDWVTNINEVKWAELGKWNIKKENKDSENYISEFVRTGSSGNSIRDAEITCKEKPINVLKINDPITNDFRYWEYFDSEGNRKELPIGTIIISPTRYTVDSNKVSHGWMYIGDLGTSDIYQARLNLAELLGMNAEDICPVESTSKYFKNEGGTNQHWMIETGGVYDNVTITNRNPDDSEHLGKKKIGPIWAFQIANDIDQGSYSLSIAKRNNTDWFAENEEGKIEGAKFKVKQEFYNATTSEKESDEIVTENGKSMPVTFEGNENVNIKMNEMGYDQYTITEFKSPDGYTKIDVSKIALKVEKKIKDTGLQIDKVELLDSNIKKGTIVVGENDDIITYDVDSNGTDDIAIKVDEEGTNIQIEVNDPQVLEGSYKMNIAKKARGEYKENGKATFKIKQFKDKQNTSGDVTAEKTMIIDVQKGENNSYNEIKFNDESEKSEISIEKEGIDTYSIKEESVTGDYVVSPNWNVILEVHKSVKDDKTRIFC